MSDAPRKMPWAPVNGAPEPAAPDPASVADPTDGAPAQDAAKQLTAEKSQPPASPKESWAPVRRASIDPTLAQGASASPIAGMPVSQPVIARPPRVPRPIDIEDPEVIRPVAAPPASEILPTSGSIPRIPDIFDLGGHEPTTFEPLDNPTDPVRLLGESAATAALFDAAGARTPAAGIPIAPISDTLPDFALDEKFVPRFEPGDGAPRADEPAPAKRERLTERSPATQAPAEAREAPRVRRGLGPPVVRDLQGPKPRVTFSEVGAVAIAAREGLDTLAPVPTPPASFTAWSDVEGELPARNDTKPQEEKPVSETPASPQIPVTPAGTALSVPATPPGPPPRDDVVVGGRGGRKLWLWITLGVLALAGIGVAVYLVFLKPDPIILPAPVVTDPPPSPTVEPIDVADDNAFLAGMPLSVSTYVLTGYEVVEVIGDTELPVRAADHLVLTYGESTSEARFTVNAYQFYNADDAAAALAAWSEGAADRHDVLVDGTTVGERAVVVSGADKVVVWRNGTSVFVLEGPADEVEQFYAYFGL